MPKAVLPVAPQARIQREGRCSEGGEISVRLLDCVSQNSWNANLCQKARLKVTVWRRRFPKKRNEEAYGLADASRKLGLFWKMNPW